MRMMVRWSAPVERSNAAIKDGSLPELIQIMTEELQPEAVYFWPENGRRAGMMIFDMKDSSQTPKIAEPLFMRLDAAVEFVPVMNADDLKAGLENAAAAR